MKMDFELVIETSNKMNIAIASSSVHIATSSKAKKTSITRKRATLTSELACEIFLIRAMPDDDSEDEILARSKNKPPRPELSSVISKIYGISPKGVRDVWNRYELSQALTCISYKNHDTKITRHRLSRVLGPLRRTWRNATGLLWDHTFPQTTESELSSIAAIAIATTAATIAYKARRLHRSQQLIAQEQSGPPKAVEPSPRIGRPPGARDRKPRRGRGTARGVPVPSTSGACKASRPAEAASRPACVDCKTERCHPSDSLPGEGADFGDFGIGRGHLHGLFVSSMGGSPAAAPNGNPADLCCAGVEGSSLFDAPTSSLAPVLSNRPLRSLERRDNAAAWAWAWEAGVGPDVCAWMAEEAASAGDGDVREDDGSADHFVVGCAPAWAAAGGRA
jgi:hypothetical protein